MLEKTFTGYYIYKIEILQANLTYRTMKIKEDLI